MQSILKHIMLSLDIVQIVSRNVASGDQAPEALILVLRLECIEAAAQIELAIAKMLNGRSYATELEDIEDNATALRGLAIGHTGTAGPLDCWWIVNLDGAIGRLRSIILLARRAEA